MIGTPTQDPRESQDRVSTTVERKSISAAIAAESEIKCQASSGKKTNNAPQEQPVSRQDNQG